MKVLIGPQEGLLGGIFSRFDMSQHAITQVIDRSLIGLNDVRKRFVASVFGLENPGFFFVHVTLCAAAGGASDFLYLLYGFGKKRFHD